jgi:hypothetical protein
MPVRYIQNKTHNEEESLYLMFKTKQWRRRKGRTNHTFLIYRFVNFICQMELIKI